MDHDRRRHVSFNRDVGLTGHAQLAVTFHRRWCPIPFCGDITADDWTDANIALAFSEDASRAIAELVGGTSLYGRVAP
jgi:hypothetical protein